MLIEHSQCGSGAICGHDGVTQFAQHIGCRSAHFFVIFDNENGLLLRPSTTSQPATWAFMVSSSSP